MLDAARKDSGLPSQELLNMIRYHREHPQELTKKLRVDAVRAGRDPDALVKKISVLRKPAVTVRLAQRPKHVGCKVVTDTQVDEQGMEFADYSEFTAAASPTPMPQDSPMDPPATPTTTSPSAERSASPPMSMQSRLGAKGHVTKPRKSKVKRQPIRPDKGTGGPISPMVVDSPQPIGESSASGAAYKALGAAPGLPSNPSSATAQPLAQPYPFPTRPVMPAWYNAVPSKSAAQLDRRRRPQDIAAIDALKDCIRRCETEKQAAQLTREHQALRYHVHKAEIKLDMNKALVKRTRILAETGLPRIFKEEANFPWDLKADAWNLYERWMAEDFEHDILRGIIQGKSKERNADQLDSNYRKEHPKDPKACGDNGAVLGQWWPTQLCAVRDGVHGMAQGGTSRDQIFSEHC